MTSNYLHFFGFTSEPFCQDIRIDNLFKRPGLDSLEERCLYAVNGRLATIITGDIGSGKSTSLRYVASKLNHNRYKVFYTIALTTSFVQVLKQIALELQIEAAHSVSVLSKEIRKSLEELSTKNQIPVVIIDEAHLLRNDIFSQLHTIFQSDYDFKPLSALILCGQTELVEILKYAHARPLASRIMGRSHLNALQLQEMTAYIEHHLTIAGARKDLFETSAIAAIHQGSGGILRTANNLAKAALIAAAKAKSQTVIADFVRLAASEMIC